MSAAEGKVDSGPTAPGQVGSGPAAPKAPMATGDVDSMVGGEMHQYVPKDMNTQFGVSHAQSFQGGAGLDATAGAASDFNVNFHPSTGPKAEGGAEAVGQFGVDGNFQTGNEFAAGTGFGGDRSSVAYGQHQGQQFHNEQGYADGTHTAEGVLPDESQLGGEHGAEHGGEHGAEHGGEQQYDASHDASHDGGEHGGEHVGHDEGQYGGEQHQ